LGRSLADHHWRPAATTPLRFSPSTDVAPWEVSDRHRLALAFRGRQAPEDRPVQPPVVDPVLLPEPFRGVEGRPPSDTRAVNGVERQAGRPPIRRGTLRACGERRFPCLLRLGSGSFRS
jgi:hypothetical protein